MNKGNQTDKNYPHIASESHNVLILFILTFQFSLRATELAYAHSCNYSQEKLKGHRKV